MTEMQNVIAQFELKGEIKYFERYGEGHINQTYLIKCDDCGKENKYIFQKINNKIFNDVPRLMNNIKLVTEFARKKILAENGDPDRETMTIINCKDGKPYYFDGQDYYRVYVYIEDSVAYQISESPEMFYQSAVAFGKFARMIAEFDATLLYESIARFHDTEKRFGDLLSAIEKDVVGRKAEVEKEIEFALARKQMTGEIVGKLKLGEIPYRVTHNDTKLNNVLFDANSGKSLAVIDLDTIMPGSLCYDFGDSIRFGCNTAAEDEPDLTKVKFDLDLFDAYTKGYLSELKGSITQSELDNLPLGAIMMTYECGIRFLEDYLKGDTYFRTSRDKHNLDRCRVQFYLVKQMEEHLDEMKDIVKKYS